MTSNKQEAFYIWTSLIVVIIGTFMAILDSSIVNIAISKIMSVFQESIENARWIITAYTLTLGAVIPLTGYLTDRFGTKRVYIFALALFTVGSLLCGMAWNTSSMIFFRIIQGLGGGMIMPVSMSIIYQIIPVNQRGLALGIWGIAAMAAPTIGPTLSGYIIEYLDWRLIFTINIPVGVVGTGLAFLLLRDPEKKEVKQKFDWIGFIASTIGIISLLYLLGEGSSIDWQDIKNIILLIVGVFSLIIFVFNELTHSSPLLDLRILKIFPFSLSIIVTSMLNMAMFGVVFIIPLFLQNLRGYSPIQTGLIMLPSAIATGIMMPIGGRIFDKIGARPLVVPGVILLAFTTYQLSKLTLDTSTNLITFYLVLRGISLGLTLMPASTAGMNSVPHHLVPRASALTNTIRQLSASLSITILTSIMQNTENLRYAEYTSQSILFNHTTVQFLNSLQGLFMSQGFTVNNAADASRSLLFSVIQRQVFLDGVNSALIISTFFALIVIPLGLLIKQTKTIKTGGEKSALKTEEIESAIITD